MTKRYDHDYDINLETSYMYEHLSGSYVLYEDYEALESDHNVLRRDYEIMMQRLKDIWVEG